MKNILTAKEERWELINNFINENKKLSYVLITTNIPFITKKNQREKIIFQEAKRVLFLNLLIENIEIVKFENIANEAGLGMIISIDTNSSRLKRLCIQIEKNHVVGRLFDLDVFDFEGKLLSRKIFNHANRRCFICDNEAKICRKKNNHSKKQIEEYIERKMDQYNKFKKESKDKFALRIQKLITYSMLKELQTTPKPGLVDKANNGSHDDMDYSLFVDSINAIKPYFYKFTVLGMKESIKDKEMLNEIRNIGLKAEKVMFESTSGINTHKGSIFSFGLLATALGRIYVCPFRYFNKKLLEKLSLIVSEWTDGIVKRELENNKISDLSNGELVYQKYKVGGARQEAENGYKSVLENSLPAYRSFINKELDENNASIQALLTLISKIDDSNILSRSNLNMLITIKNKAQDILNVGGIITKGGWQKYIEFIDYVENNNLSPGGSADLLAVTIFFHNILKEKKEIFLKMM